MDLEASPASQLRPLSSTEPFRTAETTAAAGGSFASKQCSQPLKTRKIQNDMYNTAPPRHSLSIASALILKLKKNMKSWLMTRSVKRCISIFR